jgi:hypothetical protein
VDPDVGILVPIPEMAAALERWRGYSTPEVEAWEERARQPFAPRALARMVAMYRCRMRSPGGRHADWWVAGGMPPGAREVGVYELAELVVRSLRPEDQTQEGAARAVVAVLGQIVDEAWLRDEWVRRELEPGGWLATSGLPRGPEGVRRRGRPKRRLGPPGGHAAAGAAT